ncbi:MAG: PP2C family protein-serine/threonine phosphatase [Anaerolineae bacterium]
MGDSVAILRGALGDLSNEDLNELARVAISRNYPPDTIIIRQGEFEHTFYIIEEGQVAVTHKMVGAEQVLGVLGPGQFFGELGLLEDAPRAASVTTLTDTRLLEIDEPTFDTIVARSPTLARTLMRGIIRHLRDTDRITIAELQLKNDELARTLADLKAAQAELLRQERIKRDLEIAADVQRSILPTEFPVVPGFEFAAQARPAREIGGDYYDVLRLDDRHYGIVMADVSGKSVQAAIYMAVVRALFLGETTAKLSPAEAMHHVHKLLMKASTAEMFVTMIYAVIDCQMRRIRYVRAGHDRPVLFRAADRSVSLLDVPGRFLGLLPDLVVVEDQFSLEPGDCLVCYSDGVTDATNANGDLFGLERLQAAIQDHGHLAAGHLVKAILAEVDAFRGEVPQPDDLTVLVTKAV